MESHLCSLLAWSKYTSNKCFNIIFNEVIFGPQVKTDESLNLEHITRTRPKGNHNRRPPTRIHMKEVGVCQFHTLWSKLFFQMMKPRIKWINKSSVICHTEVHFFCDLVS